MNHIDFSSYFLAAHVPEFQACVMHHLKEVMPKEEYAALRRIASEVGDAAAMPGAAELQALSTPEELVATAVCEASLSMAELDVHFKPTHIGTIAGQPVCYFAGRGIYAWARDRDESAMLELWVTAPAYPPGW